MERLFASFLEYLVQGELIHEQQNEQIMDFWGSSRETPSEEEPLVGDDLSTIMERGPQLSTLPESEQKKFNIKCRRLRIQNRNVSSARKDVDMSVPKLDRWVNTNRLAMENLVTFINEPLNGLTDQDIQFRSRAGNNIVEYTNNNKRRGV